MINPQTPVGPVMRELLDRLRDADEALYQLWLTEAVKSRPGPGQYSEYDRLKHKLEGFRLAYSYVREQFDVGFMDQHVIDTDTRQARFSGYFGEDKEPV